MPHKDTRKIIKVGETSFAVILPKAWLRYYNLDHRNHVKVVSNSKIIIEPLEKVAEGPKPTINLTREICGGSHTVIKENSEPLNNFRTKIVLRCYHCNKQTEIHTTQPMICRFCGLGFEWLCYKCHTSFSPDEAILCLRCRWFKCPKCLSCGCTFHFERKDKPEILKKPAQSVHEFA